MFVSAAIGLMTTLIVNGVSISQQATSIIKKAKEARDANDLSTILTKVYKEIENNMSTLNDIASENSSVLSTLKYFTNLRGNLRKIRMQTIKDWETFNKEITDQKSALNTEYSRLMNVSTAVTAGTITAEEGQEQMNEITKEVFNTSKTFNSNNESNAKKLGTDIKSISTNETSKEYNTKYRTSGGQTKEAEQANNDNTHKRASSEEVWKGIGNLITGTVSDADLTDDQKVKNSLTSDLTQTYTERR